MTDPTRHITSSRANMNRMSQSISRSTLLRLLGGNVAFIITCASFVLSEDIGCKQTSRCVTYMHVSEASKCSVSFSGAREQNSKGHMLLLSCARSSDHLAMQMSLDLLHAAD